MGTVAAATAPQIQFAVGSMEYLVAKIISQALAIRESLAKTTVAAAAKAIEVANGTLIKIVKKLIRVLVTSNSVAAKATLPHDGRRGF